MVTKNSFPPESCSWNLLVKCFANTAKVLVFLFFSNTCEKNDRSISDGIIPFDDPLPAAALSIDDDVCNRLSVSFVPLFDDRRIF